MPNSDTDGLNDGEEVEWGTDPLNPNTDGDEDDDAYEAAHIGDGLDPVIHDTKTSKLTYIAEATKGFIFGDVWPSDSLAWLSGTIASSFIPLVDLRDVLGAAIHGDWVGAGFNSVGLIPIAGDAASVITKTTSFIATNPHMAGAAIAFIAKAEDIPSPMRLEAVRAGLKAGTWDKLKNANVSDDTILTLAQGRRTDLDVLADVLNRPGHVRGVPGRWNDGWRAGEQWVEDLFGASARGYDKQVWVPTRHLGLGWGRYVDVLVDNIARETKSGHIKLNDRIRKQVAKDAALRGSVDGFDGVHWHFVASWRGGGSIGADQELFDLLDANGIPYTIHIP